MATNEELIQAAKLLKEYCEAHESSCTGCIFYNSRAQCMFARGKTGHLPGVWQIPKPRRWTDADIQLAKALKAFGVKEVYRYGENWPSGRGDDKSTSCCELPDSAFSSLREEGETVSIDNILKGAEE